MPRISLKAFVISNLAHGAFIALSSIVAIVLYVAIATISSNGSADPAIFAQVKHSPALVDTIIALSFIAPIPAGYIAAKFAPRDKLINGGLATTAWILISLYSDIWGSHEPAAIPHWLDLLGSYAVPIPAVFGAYLWQWRNHKRTAESSTIAAATLSHPEYQQPQEAPAAVEVERNKQARRRNATRGGVGAAAGAFLFLISNFLLTEHERNIVTLSIFIIFALLIVALFAYKKLRKPSAPT
jgi:hypothetical protein